mmetsp:Transcript_67440/g.152528  ORF Transcript_67440/g.152528 Transcript_67440/m.152528 type:complete len:297 (+) Transcript_67440:75-965(+)
MAPSYDFETLAVTRSAECPNVLEVALNRPDKLNALNSTFWREITKCMRRATEDAEVFSVIIHGGECRIFCCGLDLNSEMGGGGASTESEGAAKGDAPKPKRHPLDVSRRALRMDQGIVDAQDAITSIERCTKPVIVALHSGVVGGGIDLACACDIRYCTEDAFFTIAEVNIGIAADVGTLQRLPKIVGNDSVVRELALTGRRMGAAEAKSLGLVGAIHADKASCLAAARATAREIASKSPVAVIGTKASLNFSRDHTVQEGLDHVRLWNSLHLQSEDVGAAVRATLTKKKAAFSRL